MANRFLVATGNWNSTSVWSTTSSGTSGASVPVSTDDVFIDSNFTVTLTADASCSSVLHTYGTLALGNYKLSVTDSSLYGGFLSQGTNARTINLGTGTLEVTIGATEFSDFKLLGSNLTISTSNSLVIINHAGFSRDFATLSKTFNGVVINMGQGTSNSATLNMTGSPVFRSLIVQSKNSAAHTINFDDGATINVQKLVVIGSSSSNRLKLDGTDEAYLITGYARSTFYGQNINLTNWDMSEYMYDSSPGSEVQMYMGTGSTISGVYGGHIIYSEPPKSSTLIDPLTTSYASNSNFIYTSGGSEYISNVTTGSNGGGYLIGSPGV